MWWDKHKDTDNKDNIKELIKKERNKPILEQY